jgi:hypothetical protein
MLHLGSVLFLEYYLKVLSAVMNGAMGGDYEMRALGR